MKRTLLATFATLASASPAFAAGGEDAGLLYPAINLLLLIAVLVYFARKPILKYFEDRRLQIQGDIETADSMRKDAEAQFASWQRKIADLETELASIREQSRQRAESERAQIVADAEATAERIRSDAGVAIEQELRRARAILHQEAADLALELAENLLREHVTDEDRARLVTEFIERVERSGAEGGR